MSKDAWDIWDNLQPTTEEIEAEIKKYYQEKGIECEPKSANNIETRFDKIVELLEAIVDILKDK